ncbi:hypothetical protein [Agrobacterium vitis]|uniref:hypothetical protein n=1 Tax=Agrobacterium vitis TaxID=373 RepID=UPI0012E90080|nr:hypothetical protein [Agrobacterium vitis]MUZ63497.1 hypothetical protein [Agrobacterium vitis]
MKKYKLVLGGSDETAPLQTCISDNINMTDEDTHRYIQTIANVAAIWGVDMARDLWIDIGLAFPSDYKR